MNAEKAYATSDTMKRWEDIDFHKAREHVKKLQIRIAKAYQDESFGKLVTLMHKLTHSFYARALAVKIVSSNRGKNTSGVDGVLWITPEDKWNAIAELKRRGYKPKPLKRVYIPKSNGTKRPLSIPTMKDRAMQTLYKLALEPIAEITADPNSYGFRTGRCTKDAIGRCAEVMSNYPEHVWILEADIKGCFDNINQNWIMNHVPMDKEILRRILSSGYIEGQEYFPTVKGVPQGGCISTIICNMALDGLERELGDSFPNIHYVRYADDFIVIGKDKGIMRHSVVPMVEAFLMKRGLSLSSEKTKITHITEGFNFLGWNVRKDNEQVVIIPSRKNQDNLLSKVEAVIIESPHESHERICQLLVPIISGWVNYHKGVVTSASLECAKSEILSCLWELTQDNRYGELINSLFFTVQL